MYANDFEVYPFITSRFLCSIFRTTPCPKIASELTLRRDPLWSMIHQRQTSTAAGLLSKTRHMLKTKKFSLIPGWESMGLFEALKHSPVWCIQQMHKLPGGK